MKIILQLSLTVCSLILGISKSMGADVIRPYSKYFFALGNVKVIAFDVKGNPWMNAAAGIVGFNDTMFAYLNQVNSNLPGQVATFAIGSDNRFWVGSKGNGLFVADGNSVANYTTSNSSLSGDFIQCIALGPNNMVWVGTGNGISEFDGASWTTYNQSNSGLPDNYVTKLLYQDSTLWVGTDGGGVAKFRKGVWTVYNTSNSGIVDNNVTDIEIDASNNVWVTSIKGLSKYDGTWKTFTTGNSAIPSNIVKSLTIDQNGKKWIGTYNGIAVYNDTAWITYNTGNSGLKNNDIFTLETGPDNRIWIGSWNTLQTFDRVNWKFYNNLNSGIGSDDNHKVISDSNNIVWLASSNGVSRYDGIRWMNFNKENAGFTYDYISAINNDRNGNIWAASGNGLFKYDGTNWTKTDPFNGTNPSYGIDCIAVGKGDTLWLGTRGGGVVCFTNGTGTTYNTGNSVLSNNTIHDILIDSKGLVWIASSGGLTSFDGQTFVNYSTLNSGFPASGLGSFDLCIDHANKLWIATSGKGLVSFDGTNWNVYNKTNSNLDYDIVYAVAADKSNNIWVSTGMTGGFFIYDGNIFNRIVAPNYSQFMNIHIGRDDVKWLSSVSNGSIIYGPCAVKDVSVTNYTITAKMDGAFYQWMDCNTGLPIQNQTGKSFTATQNGKYAVIITYGFCSDTSVCTDIQGLSGVQVPEKIISSIYPNPANSVITVVFSTAETGEMEIMDLMGCAVLTKEVHRQQAVDISVESLQSGVYLIRRGNEVVRFIKY